MQNRFKRHQKVRLLIAPSMDDIEPYKDPPVPITAGMTGEVNVILPNGQYHVRISDENGEEIAYVVVDEEGLEAAEDE
jgi:hypothetical protein